MPAMLSWWQAVGLGLVEGVTEYLPVSSTGHLILTSSLLGLEHPDTKEALDAYLVVVQGGAILAVLFLYWSRVVQMVRGVLGRDPDGVRLAVNLVLAFLPAALAGALLSHAIKAVLFSPWPVLFALAAGGVWMLWLGRRGAHATRDLTAISWQTAVGIGIFQTLALWPGTSRSMVTIGGGVLFGLNLAAAAEFSFLLGLPTLGAACVHDLAGNLRHGGPSMFQQLGAVPMAVGFAVATIAALLSVRWLVGFLTRRGLAPFGWYRLALSVAFAALILLGTIG